MEFQVIKQECKTEPVETMSFKSENTMDFKKELDDDDTFDHRFLPGLATRSFHFCFLFVKTNVKTNEVLGGKSMTPRLGNAILPSCSS